MPPPRELQRGTALGGPWFLKTSFLERPWTTAAEGLLGRVLLCLVSAQNELKRSRVLIWILVVSREKQNGNPHRRRG